MKRDYEDQLERLRVLKEQEVAAATSMFSQTKSLQTLIQQVQNSASEVSFTLFSLFIVIFIHKGCSISYIKLVCLNVRMT